MTIKWYLSDLMACGYMRGEYIALELQRHYTDLHVDVKRDFYDSDFPGTDAMIFQRPHTQRQFVQMRVAQSKGIRCAVEWDDDMLNMPDNVGPLTEMFRSPQVRDMIRACIQYSDALVVTTKELAGALRQYSGKNIWIVPNFINAEAYEIAETNKRTKQTDSVCIGWTNSPVHILEAPMMEPILKTVMTKYPNTRLMSASTVNANKLWKWTEDDAFKGRFGFSEGVHLNDMGGLIEPMDIGIAPLIDHPFNRSRSNIKWQQYGIMGIPTVATKGPVYEDIRHGETGFLCSTEDEWITTLSRLIEDTELRRKVGIQTRLEVLNKWDLRKRYVVWRDTFREILKDK